MAINWISTKKRLPTEEEHDAGVVALWAWPTEKPCDYEVEKTNWKPRTWGQTIQMPTHWAFLSEFDLPPVTESGDT